MKKGLIVLTEVDLYRYLREGDKCRIADQLIYLINTIPFDPKYIDEVT
jgi:hypothetical protein